MVRKDAKPSIRYAMLAVIFLVAGTSSAAFGDETSAGVTVLRGTPARVEQPREPQPVQMMPPPLPSCPDGYAYSSFLGNCYRPRDPLNPGHKEKRAGLAQEPPSRIALAFT
jgi:hypothetical protein